MGWRRRLRVLLDTHALLWAVLSPASVSSAAAALIVDEENAVLVSAASAWEIAAKVRLGKLPGAEALEKEFLDVMEETGYTLLPIDAKNALRAGRLIGQHRDPFDRIIAAQGMIESLTVVTADEKLTSFAGIRTMW